MEDWKTLAGISFRLDGIKKHTISEVHKTAKLAHDASNAQPGTAPLEVCLINMEKEALDRLVKTFSYRLLSGSSRTTFQGFCWTMQPPGKKWC